MTCRQYCGSDLLMTFCYSAVPEVFAKSCFAPIGTCPARARSAATTYGALVETFCWALCFPPPFFFGWAGASRTGNCHTDRSGRACTDLGCSRKTQNKRRFWPPPLLSSRLKSAHGHRDRGCPGRETQNCRRFWFRLLSSHLRGAPHFLHFSLKLLFRGRSLEFEL